jgi:hypothetical protein
MTISTKPVQASNKSGQTLSLIDIGASNGVKIPKLLPTIKIVIIMSDG